MYRCILVPLDGSSAGRRALAWAGSLAARDGARIELVHVHEPFVYDRGGVPTIDSRFDADMRREMRTTLERVRARLGRELTALGPKRGTAADAASGERVSATFLDGEVVPTLGHHIDTTRPDLIVMTSHGRGGLSRFWLGSVAEALVRHGGAPILLIRGKSVRRAAGPFVPKRILVALDGGPAAESVLDAALQLGTPSQTEYLLVHVVHPAISPWDPSATPSFAAEEELTDSVRHDAERYLAAFAERLRGAGVTATTNVVTAVQAAPAVLEAARAGAVEVIALATRARSPLVRLALGSVADKIVRGATVPTLIVHDVATAAKS